MNVFQRRSQDGLTTSTTPQGPSTPSTRLPSSRDLPSRLTQEHPIASSPGQALDTGHQGTNGTNIRTTTAGQPRYDRSPGSVTQSVSEVRSPPAAELENQEDIAVSANYTTPLLVDGVDDDRHSSSDEGPSQGQQAEISKFCASVLHIHHYDYYSSSDRQISIR